jgi:molecular chaperone DnaK (HSP70)
MNFIGIDFGTHNCSICLVNTDSSNSYSNSCDLDEADITNITNITNKADRPKESYQLLDFNMPSVIHIGDEILIGNDAINLNENNISYFKRLLCLKENEKHLFNFDYYNKNETIYIKTNKGDFSITQIIGMFFSKLKEKIDKKIDIYSCIITVPAFFNENQRKIIWNAVQLSSLPCIKLLNEPTSACIAYFDKYDLYNDYNNKNILVFDFGAGTLDLTIVRMEDEICEVLGIFGINNSLYLSFKYKVKIPISLNFDWNNV